MPETEADEALRPIPTDKPDARRDVGCGRSEPAKSDRLVLVLPLVMPGDNNMRDEGRREDDGSSGDMIVGDKSCDPADGEDPPPCMGGCRIDPVLIPAT